MKVKKKDYVDILAHIPRVWFLYECTFILSAVLLEILHIFFLYPVVVLTTCLGDCSGPAPDPIVQDIIFALLGLKILFSILFLLQVSYNTYFLINKKAKLHVLTIIKTVSLAITPLIFYFLVTIFLTFFYASTLPNMTTPTL